MTEFDEFVARVRKELIPKIEGSDIFVSICPVNKDKMDVKFAVELGLAIMYNKPIIAMVQAGTPIPEKLARVVERFVEVDFADPVDCKNRLTKVLNEMNEE